VLRWKSRTPRFRSSVATLRLTAAGVSDSRRAAVEKPPVSALLTKHGDRVTTYKTYHGTHRGEFLGVAPAGRKIRFETVDVMRVRDGKIAEHWGVANLFFLMQQLGAWPASEERI
jgi:hypothetical protein